MDIKQNKEIAERLKIAREHTGLNQSKLADSLGITRGHWSNLEAGRAIPNTTLLLLFQEIYKIRAEWIINGTDQMFADNTIETANAGEKKNGLNLGELREEKTDIKSLVRQALNDERAGEHTHKLLLAYMEELLARTMPVSPWSKDQFQIRRTGERRLESTEMAIKIPEPPADLDDDGRYYWEKNSEALERWAKTPGAIEAFPRRKVPDWAIERFLREMRHMYEGGSIADVSGALWDLMEEGPNPKK